MCGQGPAPGRSTVLGYDSVARAGWRKKRSSQWGTRGSKLVAEQPVVAHRSRPPWASRAVIQIEAASRLTTAGTPPEPVAVIAPPGPST